MQFLILSASEEDDLIEPAIISPKDPPNESPPWKPSLWNPVFAPRVPDWFNLSILCFII